MSLQGLSFTVEQAAELLGVGRNTAYDAARKGDLPVLRIGRRLVVPAARLAALLGVTTEELALRAAAASNDNQEPSHDQSVA
jgi:excisionase family DNA binding protein